jgi:hypothetical protein
MSTFERDEYKWRETYLVLFDSAKRPSLKNVEHVLRDLNDRFELSNARGDEDGRFESITVTSQDDYAALDIIYNAGEEVVEDAAALQEELKTSATDGEERARIARLAKCDARFDLLHFEHVTSETAEDDPDEMLDPSALLIVMDALVELTEGVGVDPASGTLL